MTLSHTLDARSPVYTYVYNMYIHIPCRSNVREEWLYSASLARFPCISSRAPALALPTSCSHSIMHRETLKGHSTRSNACIASALYKLLRFCRLGGGINDPSWKKYSGCILVLALVVIVAFTAPCNQSYWQSTSRYKLYATHTRIPFLLCSIFKS